MAVELLLCVKNSFLRMIILNFDWLIPSHSRLNRNLFMVFESPQTVPKRYVELNIKTGDRSRRHSLFIYSSHLLWPSENAANHGYPPRKVERVRTISVFRRLIRQIEHCRTCGNPPSSMKREPSVIFDNLRGNRTWHCWTFSVIRLIRQRENRISSVTLLKIWENRTLFFRKSSVTGLFRQVEHCVTLSSGIPWNIPLIICIFLVETLA